MNWFMGILGGIVLVFLLLRGATDGNGLATLVVCLAVTTLVVMTPLMAFPSLRDLRRNRWFIGLTTGISLFVLAALWLIFDAVTFVALVIYLLFIVMLALVAALSYMLWRHHTDGHDGEDPNPFIAVVSVVVAAPIMLVIGLLAMSLFASAWQTERYSQMQERYSITDEQVMQQRKDWCPGIIEGLPWGESAVCSG